MPTRPQSYQRRKEAVMGQEIRGKYVNGKVELLEESDLEEGEEVRVIAPIRKKDGNAKPFMSTSGTWKDDADYWDEFLREWYIKRGRITS